VANVERVYRGGLVSHITCKVNKYYIMEPMARVSSGFAAFVAAILLRFSTREKGLNCVIHSTALVTRSLVQKGYKIGPKRVASFELAALGWATFCVIIFSYYRGGKSGHSWSREATFSRRHFVQIGRQESPIAF